MQFAFTIWTGLCGATQTQGRVGRAPHLQRPCVVLQRPGRQALLEPRVLLDLGDRDALARIAHEDLADQVLRRGQLASMSIADHTKQVLHRSSSRAFHMARRRSSTSLSAADITVQQHKSTSPLRVSCGGKGGRLALTSIDTLTSLGKVKSQRMMRCSTFCILSASFSFLSWGRDKRVRRQPPLWQQYWRQVISPAHQFDQQLTVTYRRQCSHMASLRKNDVAPPQH